jgi:hypothetical protein
MCTFKKVRKREIFWLPVRILYKTEEIILFYERQSFSTMNNKSVQLYRKHSLNMQTVL